MNSISSSQPENTLFCNIFDEILSGKEIIPFVKIDDLEKNGVYIFGVFDEKAPINPFHVGLLLVLEKSMYKFHYTTNYEIILHEVKPTDLTSCKILDLKYIPHRNNNLIIKGIIFNLNRIIRSISKNFINIVYKYPYEIDNATFNKINQSNSSSEIQVSSFTVTCSTLVIYAVNSIMRKDYEYFEAIDALSWPSPYDVGITNLPVDVLNIRVSSKECFNIGIPDNEKAFPLTNSICNKLAFS